MSHKNQIIITWQSCALGVGVEGNTALSLLVLYMPLNSLLLHIIPVMHSMRYLHCCWQKATYTLYLNGLYDTSWCILMMNLMMNFNFYPGSAPSAQDTDLPGGPAYRNT